MTPDLILAVLASSVSIPVGRLCVVFGLKLDVVVGDAELCTLGLLEKWGVSPVVFVEAPVVWS